MYFINKYESISKIKLCPLLPLEHHFLYFIAFQPLYGLCVTLVRNVTADRLISLEAHKTWPCPKAAILAAQTHVT